MKPLLTAQQLSFFSNNGFLELAEFLSPEECVQFLTIAQQSTSSRDLWRVSPAFKTLGLSQKLPSIVLQAVDEGTLHLALDQWMEPGFTLEKPAKLTDLFSIQGLVCAVLFRFCSGDLPTASAPLGLLPFPRTPGSALLVRPGLLLQWPPVSFGLYVIAYARPKAVYVHNPRDPAGDALKKFGYAYGDVLRNDVHPLVQRK